MFLDILSIVPRTSWYTNKRIMQALNSVSFRADRLASVRLGHVLLLLLSYFKHHVLAVLIAVISSVRRVIKTD